MDRSHPSWRAEVASPRPLAIAVEPLRGRPEATVVLKLTYAPDERGVAALHPEQQPLFPTPVPSAYGGVALPSDVGGPRAACDVLLVGEVSALGGPVSFNVNERGWRAAHARGLGPLERLTDRGWAPFPQRIPFPRLPLTITLASPGLSTGCTLAGPEPFVAVACEPHWQPQPLQLALDRVAVDVDRGRFTLSYRGTFPMASDGFIVLADPAPTPAFYEQARGWPRSPIADLAALASRGAGPLLVPVTGVPAPAAPAPHAPQVAPMSAPPAAVSFGAPPRSAGRGPLHTVIEDEPSGSDGALPFSRPGAARAVSPPLDARDKAMTAPLSRSAGASSALPFRSLEAARSLVTPADTPPPAPAPQPVPPPAPVLAPPPPPARPSSPLSAMAQPSYLRAQAARERAAATSAASALTAPGPSPGPGASASGEAVPRDEIRIDGLTLDEIASIRGDLATEPDQRRALLKERGLTELRWRLIERRLAEHLRRLEARPVDLVREVRALRAPRAEPSHDT